MGASAVPDQVTSSGPCHRQPRSSSRLSPGLSLARFARVRLRHAVVGWRPLAASRPSSQSTWYVLPDPVGGGEASACEVVTSTAAGSPRPAAARCRRWTGSAVPPRTRRRRGHVPLHERCGSARGLDRHDLDMAAGSPAVSSTTMLGPGNGPTPDIAARTNARNSGCGRSGRLLNSGWNWLATNQGWSRSSTISTRRPSGDWPEMSMPADSSASRYWLLTSNRWR